MEEQKADSPSVDCLNDEQRTEIKKVFSVADKNGDGSIDRSELRDILKQLSGGQSPSAQEVETLFARVDKDGNGKISCDEFLASLQEWLAEEKTEHNETQHTPKKRKASEPLSDTPGKLRAKIHKRISSFFLQATKPTNFDELRKRFLQFCHTEQDGIDAEGEVVSRFHDHTATPAQKIALLEKCKNYSEHSSLTKAQEQLQSANTGTVIAAARQLAECFSICDVMSAAERYECGVVIMDLFINVANFGIPPLILRFLAVDQVSDEIYELQELACRFVGCFANGPRLPHTPADSPHHPSLMSPFKVALFQQCHTHVLLAKHLYSNCKEVREQAVVAIGKVASYDAQARDWFLDAELPSGVTAFTALYQQLQDNTHADLRQKVTWALSIFCGVTHKQPADLKKIQCAFPKLQPLFAREDFDEVVIVNVLLCLRHLTTLPLQQQECARLVKLLQSTKPHIRYAALSIIQARVQGKDGAVAILLNAHLGKRLVQLLKQGEAAGGASLSPASQAFDVLLGLAADHGQDLLACPGLIAAVASYLDRPSSTAPTAAHLLGKLCTHPSFFAPEICQLEIVRRLGRALADFRSYDPVMREVYSHHGPTFNFVSCFEIYVSLAAIKEACCAALEQTPGASCVLDVVRQFDESLIDRLRGVLLHLVSSKADEADSWREMEPRFKQIEDNLTKLLLSIQHLHEQGNPDKSSKAAVSVLIANTLTELQTEAKANEKALHLKRQQKRHGFVAVQRVRVHCICQNGDNRVLEGIPRNIKLEELKKQVLLKYNNHMLLKFKEANNTYLLDSDEILAHAWGLVDQANQRHLEQVEHKSAFVSGLKNYELLLEPMGPGWQGAFPNTWHNLNPSPHSSQQQDFTSLLPGMAPPPLTLANDQPLFNFNNESNNKSTKECRYYRAGRCKFGATCKFSHGYVPPSQHQSNLSREQRRALHNLKQSTNFNHQQLSHVKQVFQRYSRNGHWDQQAFSQACREAFGIVDNSEQMQLFSSIDRNKDGMVSEKELWAGFTVMLGGNLTDRYKLAFQAYDKDGNGYIDKKELFDFLKQCYFMQGFTNTQGNLDSKCSERVNEIFQLVDTNRDGRLDEREFVQGCLNNPNLVSAFWGDNFVKF